MKKKDKQKVLDIIKNEGFNYTFNDYDYTSFTEIEDDKFHLLIQEYIAARAKLAKYVGFNL